MGMVKYFNKQGYVELKDIQDTFSFKGRIIRVIPEKHKMFNIEEMAYIDLNKDNMNYLSEGDMVILKDTDGSTYWHELIYNEQLRCLCYKGDYSILDEVLLKKYEISVRNDFYISPYARPI
jgi:hypothetical protein